MLYVKLWVLCRFFSSFFLSKTKRTKKTKKKLRFWFRYAHTHEIQDVGGFRLDQFFKAHAIHQQQKMLSHTTSLVDFYSLIFKILFDTHSKLINSVFMGLRTATTTTTTTEKCHDISILKYQLEDQVRYQKKSDFITNYLCRTWNYSHGIHTNIVPCRLYYNGDPYQFI